MESSMKTALLTCVLLAIAALPARAGLDLTWNACNLSVDHISQVTFDCSRIGVPYEAFGCFQIAAGQDSFVEMDFVIDLCVNSATLPDFWHFENCDSTGVVLMHFRPTEPAGICAGTIDPWSSTTTSSLL